MLGLASLRDGVLPRILVGGLILIKNPRGLAVVLNAEEQW